MKLLRHILLPSVIEILLYNSCRARAATTLGLWMLCARAVVHSIGLTKGSALPESTILYLGPAVVKAKSKLPFHNDPHLHFGSYSLGFTLFPIISLPTFSSSTLHWLLSQQDQTMYRSLLGMGLTCRKLGARFITVQVILLLHQVKHVNALSSGCTIHDQRNRLMQW